MWRFNTIPQPGEPGHESWENDAWKHGGGSIWTTGSYDPALNLIYWGIGNASPDWNGDVRPGDNLYTSSVIIGPLTHRLPACTGSFSSPLMPITRPLFFSTVMPHSELQN